MDKLLDFPDIWGRLELKKSFADVLNATNRTYGFHDLTQQNEDQNVHHYTSVITGILLVLLINVVYSKEASQKTKQKNLRVESKYQQSFGTTTICTFISVLISPIIFTTIITFAFYRRIIEAILKKKYGEQFHGLLEGTDAVWAIEDVSKSVINVLALIEHEEPNDILLTTLRKKISELFSNGQYKKLCCLREKEYGYYFWKETKIQINKHVREMISFENVQGENTKNKMEKVLSFYANSSLPHCHKSAVEILVGLESFKEGNESKMCPILFRVHHSVGDGIVLISILLNSLADKHCDFFKHNKICNNIVYKKLPPSPEGSPTKIVKISYTNKVVSMKLKSTDPLMRNVKSLCRGFLLSLFGPGCLMQQLLARKIDNSVLHGSKLTGEKRTVWLVEDQPELIETIKKIKKKVQNASFSDVLLTGVSASFNEYFQKYDVKVPDTITVVVPVRIPETGRTCNQPKLQNRFSVAMLNLPINISYLEKSNLINRLFEIKKETDFLRKSWDYEVNYWLLSVISKLMPEPVLRPLVFSAQSTTVLSNVPGPHEITICEGYHLKNLIFWLPNRGLTGLGVSVLSYGGRLQLGLIADKALIPTTQAAQDILQNTFKYLRELDHLTSTV